MYLDGGLPCYCSICIEKLKLLPNILNSSFSYCEINNNCYKTKGDTKKPPVKEALKSIMRQAFAFFVLFE
jgi:hypothetical protein